MIWLSQDDLSLINPDTAAEDSGVNSRAERKEQHLAAKTTENDTSEMGLKATRPCC